MLSFTDYCCSAKFVPRISSTHLRAADKDPSGIKRETLPFLLFHAEQRPPSAAWRPVALTLLALCLVLLTGLAALGFVCKSAL